MNKWNVNCTEGLSGLLLKKPICCQPYLTFICSFSISLPALFKLFFYVIFIRYAVERINHNKEILPRSRLSAQIEKIPPQDSFHASKRGGRILTCFQRRPKGPSPLFPSRQTFPCRIQVFEKRSIYNHILLLFLHCLWTVQHCNRISVLAKPLIWRIAVVCYFVWNCSTFFFPFLGKTQKHLSRDHSCFQGNLCSVTFHQVQSKICPGLGYNSLA